MLQVYFVLVTMVRVDGFGFISHMVTQGGALRKTQGFVASLFRVSNKSFNCAGGRLWFVFTHGHSRRSTEEDAGIYVASLFRGSNKSFNHS